MKLIKARDYEEMSLIVAQKIVEEYQSNASANTCLATGSSPDLAYELFVKEVRKQELETSKMVITKLDEWCDIDMDSPASCERFLQDRIIRSLNIEANNYISFQSDAIEPEVEIENIQKSLEERPLDLCILGLGKNGHLGLNEPSSFLTAGAHIAKLNEVTQTHSMIKELSVSRGMTLGMYDILNAKKVILMVSGEGKNAIYKEFLTKKVQTSLPASFLWLHNNVEVIVQSDIFE